MKEKFELRSVFNEKSIRQTAKQIKEVHPSFQDETFITATLEGFESLSFGDRNTKITDNLFQFLPDNYAEALKILVTSLGEPLVEEELEGYDGFYVMPLSTYVRRYGTEYYELSMAALIEMTKRFTSEWAIRIFLEQEQEKTLAYLKKCAISDNCHVRRLVSEGSRPRLPLSSRLYQFMEDPRPVFELLELLKNEPTRLVQRSIANNLNDIGKDNPDAVVSFLKRWQEEGVKDVDWIIKHATRSLIKEGHPEALRLLGFEPDIGIKSADLRVKRPSVTLGNALEFECEIIFKNSEETKVVVDYLLYFKKANGELRPKVFKLSSTTVAPNATLKLSKKHSLKQATTRRYYEGKQAIQLQVNGKLVGEKTYFDLAIT